MAHPDSWHNANKTFVSWYVDDPLWDHNHCRPTVWMSCYLKSLRKDLQQVAQTKGRLSAWHQMSVWPLINEEYCRISLVSLFYVISPLTATYSRAEQTYAKPRDKKGACQRSWTPLTLRPHPPGPFSAPGPQDFCPTCLPLCTLLTYSNY